MNSRIYLNIAKEPNHNINQNLSFAPIKEETGYDKGFAGSYSENQNNFMSEKIPEVEGFDYGGEGGLFSNYPTHTPTARGSDKKKSQIVGTEEDRNSKGINGLLELAGTQYQSDQFGEERE